jgi:hypothetical protein
VQACRRRPLVVHAVIANDPGRFLSVHDDAL